MGEQGKIEESEKLAEEAEMLRKRKEEMIRTHENPMGNNKEMKVCEICGAL